jgi:Fur family transcriptional regulator, ferric uptake regulator
MKNSSPGRLKIVRPAADTATVVDALKGQGFRITKVRRALLDILTTASHPMSVPELLPALAKCDLMVNKTTVYRELDFLLENQIVLELDLLDGAKRYELLQPDHHHHHLVCTKCGMIECVEMHHDLDEIEARIATNHKFKVSSHVLEFFGLCEKCY